MTDTSGILGDRGTMTTNLPVYTNDIVWRIEEFMSLPQKTGECITSKLIATFKRHSAGCQYMCQCRKEPCPGVLWQLQVYPRGRSAEDNEYVSILLSLKGSGVQNVSYKVIMENSNGYRGSRSTICEEHGYSENLPRDGVWGWSKFIKRSSGCLTDITIRLSIKHPGPVSKQVIPPPKMVVKDNNVDKKFLAMYKDQLETDTEIVVGKGDGIKVHKFVLLANSCVFEKMLTSDCVEAKNNVINIKDIDREVCEIMVLFMYGEELPPAADLTIEASEELLYAAEKYVLNGLKASCEQVLSAKITSENVADILVTSDLYRAKTLKGNCYQYIKANKKQVAETKKFQSVLRKHKRLLWEAFQV